MKKIVVVTEGQTELIFIRELLLRLIDASKLSFVCITLNADIMQRVREYSAPNPDVYFQIINVQNDEKVLSFIGETEESFIKRGFERIIGLRDMYSNRYKKRSPGAIDDNVTKQFIKAHRIVIRKMKYWNRIKLYYAIMEIEAWFLAMYKIFERINSYLSIDSINSDLGLDLAVTDPEKEYYRPTKQVQDIFALAGLEYKKNKANIENITSNMLLEDISTVIGTDKCSSFKVFCREISSFS